MQLMQQVSSAYYYVATDDLYTADHVWIRKEWSNARFQLKQSGKDEMLFIIDEVQKAPNWSEAVKKEWDTDSFSGVQIKVILLGSSRMLIQKGLTELLAGRFELIHVTHWSFDEMRDAFDWSLDQYIFFRRLSRFRFFA